MYQLHSKVRYSESGSDNRLTCHGLLNYLQDCTTLHAESLGQSGADLLEQNMAWILTFWQICIEEMPKLSEDITVSTWPYSTQGLFGQRNFCIDKKDGSRVVRANSIWVLMDPRNGHVIRIPEEVASHYKDEPKLPMDYCRRKIAIPEEYIQMEAIRVPKHFIDTNQHMNNAKYVMVAEEYLPRGFEVAEIRVEYRKAAVLGDMIYPRVTLTKEDMTVVLADEEGNIYSTVLFLKRV